MAFKDLFSFLFQRSSGEERVAQYVIREHDRGRPLAEIMEDRYGLRSTVWTSQLPIEKWHDHMADPTIADAICDRLLHNAHRLVLQGPSRRKNQKAED